MSSYIFIRIKLSKERKRDARKKKMSKTLYIEAESFHRNTIFNSNVPPYGYGLDHVKDINTEETYTLIFKGSKVYSYLEKEDGTLIY